MRDCGDDGMGRVGVVDVGGVADGGNVFSEGGGQLECDGTSN